MEWDKAGGMQDIEWEEEWVVTSHRDRDYAVVSESESVVVVGSIPACYKKEGVVSKVV